MSAPPELPVFGHSQLVVVAATDVVIQGFTIDGDSPTLTPTGVLDARNGVILDETSGDWHQLRLEDLVVRNSYLSGIHLAGETHASGNAVLRTTVANIRAVPSLSAGIIFRQTLEQFGHGH